MMGEMGFGNRPVDDYFMNAMPPSPILGTGIFPVRPRKGVFFHADDMGATPVMTARLFESWEAGLLDSFSVFGNCDHPDTISVRLGADLCRPVRISVHLNLWEGKPLSPANHIGQLVDRFGYFNSGFFRILNRYHCAGTDRERNTLVSQIEREWRAQIENVIGMIALRPLTALDGHIHMHMVPFLFRLAVKLAKEYHIPEIRNVREPFYLSRNIEDCLSKRFLVNCLKRGVLTAFSSQNAKHSETEGLRSPDRLLGVLYSGMMNRANIAAGIAAARRSGARRIEVLVHIGKADVSELGRWNGSTSKASFVLSPSRDTEFAELTRLRAPRPLLVDMGRAS
jgi:predicted glycoside hydrolase/deacetylase ChbG (UPF0249 family)